MSTADSDIQSGGALQALKHYLQGRRDLEFAVLVGSRTNGQATPESDWDIALQWRQDNKSYPEQLARTENTRHDIATVLHTEPDKVDLIDVPSTKLAMRELIANHGIILTDPESLPWLYFLQRTWRDLEDYYWEELYVA